LEIACATPTIADHRRRLLTNLTLGIICQVCWRTRRWHNGRTRRFRNVSFGTSPRRLCNYLGRVRSASHQGHELRLTQRPDTFAQTILQSSFFACSTAADHTFRIGGENEAAGAALAAVVAAE
jgi:hypothetical protein